MWKQCEALQETIVSLRRKLHQIPEVGSILPKTQALICETLEAWGVPYEKSPLDSAVFGEIRGGKPGKTILLRADTDALPILEETGLPYASQHPGQMHACGHDAHTAMLLGALKVLQENREQLCGNVRFVFQPCEENIGGASVSIKAGVMEGVDAVFGCHIGNLLGTDMPSGTFAIAPGCVMASSDGFRLYIQGKGCHGSTPDKGVDPIVIAAHTIINLEELKAREIPAPQPTSLTVGYIKGGEATNIIPDTVELGGTLRAHDPANRRFVLQRIQEVAEGTAAMFRGSCRVEISGGAKVVQNDPALAAVAASAAEKVVGSDFVRTSFQPCMGSEDFSEYLAIKPGVFWFLCSANDDPRTQIPHHNPRFDIDEDVLWKGSAVFVSLANDYLK